MRFVIFYDGLNIMSHVRRNPNSGSKPNEIPKLCTGFTFFDEYGVHNVPNKIF